MDFQPEFFNEVRAYGTVCGNYIGHESARLLPKRESAAISPAVRKMIGASDTVVRDPDVSAHHRPDDSYVIIV